MSHDSDPGTPAHPAPSAPDEGGAGATAGIGPAAPDDRPLPPLPDGGLAAAMPDWLRGEVETAGPVRGDREGDAARSGAEVIDPTTFLSDEDLPGWLRRFAVGQPGAVAAGDGAAGRRIVAEPAPPRRSIPLPPAAPRSLSRGTEEPAPGSFRRERPEPVAAEAIPFDRRAVLPLAEPDRTADRGAMPASGRATPAAGGSRAVPIGLLLVLVLIVALLVVVGR